MAAGLVVAGLGKAAQLPFSFWLSRAMHGPSPVSALLHSAAMVAMGGYLLLRVAPTLAATGWADDAAAWAGAATAVLLGLVALAQSDLKQLLAASTAAQLGFVVLAAGVGATAGGATHLVAHAAVKAGLFLAAGIWLQALGTKRLSSLTGAARIWPVVGACAAASLLSLAGLPPLALWATKDAVLAAAATQSAALYVAGLLGAALSAAYATKALVVLTRRLPDDPESGWDGERDGTRTAPTTAWAPLLPLAAGAVVLGVLALPPLLARVQELVGGAAPEPGTLELVTSALLAVAVIVATVVAMRGAPSRRLTRPRVLTSWLFLEQLAHRTVVRPVEVLAHRLAHLDDAVLDRGVEATARGTARLTRLAARVDDRAIDGGVTAVVSGVRRPGRSGPAAPDRAAAPVLPPGAGRAGRRPRPRPREVNVLSVLVFLPLLAAAGLLVAPDRCPRGARRLRRRHGSRAGGRLPGVGEVRDACAAGAGTGGAGPVDPGRGVELPRRRRRPVAAAGSDDHRGVRGLRGLRRRGARSPRLQAALFLFLEAVCLGLFVSADLILFFVFFDLSIVACTSRSAAGATGTPRGRR